MRKISRKHSKPVNAAVLAQYKRLHRRLRREKTGMLPKSFAATVEHDFTGSGKFAVPRRFALAFLERPWREVAKEVKKDRELAINVAQVAKNIRTCIPAYESLVKWLDAASLRMLACICVRTDSNAI